MFPFVIRGAKIDKHDKDNFTPLLIAACNGHADTIKTLLDHGADLFAVDKNDKTAIFWAAEEDNVEALQVREKEMIMMNGGCRQMYKKSNGSNVTKWF